MKYLMGKLVALSAILLILACVGFATEQTESLDLTNEKVLSQPKKTDLSVNELREVLEKNPQEIIHNEELQDLLVGFDYSGKLFLHLYQLEAAIPGAFSKALNDDRYAFTVMKCTAYKYRKFDPPNMQTITMVLNNLTLRADQGHPTAICSLAKIHEFNKCLLYPQSNISFFEIVEFYKKAANKGCLLAQQVLEKKYSRRYFMTWETDLSSDELKEFSLYTPFFHAIVAENPKLQNLVVDYLCLGEIRLCDIIGTYDSSNAANVKITTLERCIPNFLMTALENDLYAHVVIGCLDSKYWESDAFSLKFKSEFLEKLQVRALQGQPWAQNNLAWIYRNGILGFQCDGDKALDLYTKSADQGCRDSQRKLSDFYYNKKFFPLYHKQYDFYKVKDYQENYEFKRNQEDKNFYLGKALEYSYKAAKQGCAESLKNLSRNLLHISNMKSMDNKYIPKILKYFTEKASQGDTGAMITLAKMSGSDTGNYIRYLTMAAEKGSLEAMEMLELEYAPLCTRTSPNPDLALKWSVRKWLVTNEDSRISHFYIKLNEDLIAPSFAPYEASSSIEDMIGIIGYWQGLHSVNLNYEDSTPNPVVYEAFQKIMDDLTSIRQCMKSLNYPGFLITCLSLQRDFFEVSNPIFFKKFDVFGEAFYAFGEENVKVATKFINKFPNFQIDLYQNHPQIDFLLTNITYNLEVNSEEANEMTIMLKGFQNDMSELMNGLIVDIIKGAANRNKGFADHYNSFFFSR